LVANPEWRTWVPGVTLSAMNVPAGEVVDIESRRQTPDRRQGDYYLRLLNGQRNQVARELASDTLILQRYQQDGDLSGVRRMRRFVRAKESELTTINRLIHGIETRFAPRV
jgi:hypothetical protein